MRPLLDAAIGRLAEADRHAVVLRFFEGKSHREIGEITGLTEDSARKRTERAVDKLRTQFSRRGLAVTVGLLAEAISTNSVQAAPAGLTETVTVAALKGAVVAGTLSSAVLFSIFTMTTKTKLIIAAIAIIAAAIPTYYLMTSGLRRCRRTRRYHCRLRSNLPRHDRRLRPPKWHCPWLRPKQIQPVRPFVFQWAVPHRRCQRPPPPRLQA